MRELYEFRVPEEWACEWLEPSDGVLGPLTKTVRIIQTEANTPTFLRIKAAAEARRKTGDWFYSYWEIRRDYTKSELNAAEMFRFEVRRAFEPCGEYLDVVYLGSGPAEHENRVGPLILKCSALKGQSLSCSIAGEVVASPAFQNDRHLLGLTGVEFLPIVCKGRRDVKSEWAEFHVTSPRVALSAKTIVGENPFSDRSSLNVDSFSINGNLLSEVFVQRESWDGSDFALSRQVIGNHVGLLRPQRLNFLSRRGYDLLSPTAKRGLQFEIVRLV